VESGRAVGVVTESGEMLRARSIVFQFEPQNPLSARLIDPSVLNDDFPRAHLRGDAASGTFRMKCRPVGRFRISRRCLAARWRSIIPPASSWRRASPTWTRPILGRQGGRLVEAAHRRNA